MPIIESLDVITTIGFILIGLLFGYVYLVFIFTFHSFSYFGYVFYCLLFNKQYISYKDYRRNPVRVVYASFVSAFFYITIAALAFSPITSYGVACIILSCVYGVVLSMFTIYNRKEITV